MADLDNLDVDELKKHIRELSKKLEEEKQENYGLMRKLQQKETLEHDLKIEHESDLADIASKDQQIKELNAKLKNASKPVIDTSERDNLIDELQQKLEELEKELRKTKEDLELAQSEKHNESSAHDLSLLRNDLINMETLHHEKCDYLEELLSNLNSELAEKAQQLCHFQSSSEQLRSELETIKEEIEQKDEELVFLRNELMLLRKPETELEENRERGNSLFSEVEDNRVKAIAALKNTTRSAEQAHQDLAVAKSEIQALKVENFSLHRKWEELVSTNIMLTTLEDGLIEKLKERIEVLNRELDASEVRSMQNLLDSIPKSTVDNNQWIKLIMQDQLKKENELTMKIRTLEMNLLYSEEAQIQLRKKSNMYIAEVTALKGELGKLKLEVGNRVPMDEEAKYIPLPEDSGDNAPYMTPSRVDALSKLFTTFEKKNKCFNVKFSPGTKSETQDDDKSEARKPARSVKSVVKTTTFLTTKK
ncbi:protein Spindly-like [Neocloeon triangulifer]|uniref:protein Spindly-like n=1 Tax=Neocloeon triangulifer TaxID=2078957 RepID=UPI00286F8201|nr:protein Spindly-like [Neocloeon triangulifer]